MILDSEVPVVTVIMPVRNEASFIARSLRSVLAQEYPVERLEVIVADGRSTDGTREIVERMAAAHPQIRLLDNPGRIVATGLNLAVLQSRGEIIVRVDGHCEIGHDHVTNCARLLREQGVDGVGGPLETVGDTPMARVIAVAMSSRFGVGGSAFRTLRDRSVLTDTVAFPAYTRAAIERAGPFDEELVRDQDDEYNYRLRKLGGRLLLSAELPVRYWSRSSLRSLGKQYFQYGFFKVRVFQKHPRQMKARQFVPPLFVGGLLVSAACAPFSLASAWTLASLVGAYAVANSVCSLQESRRLSKRLPPALPLAFATMHLAYGAGFLAGLFRFWNRWANQDAPVLGRRLEASVPKIGGAPVEASKR